MIPPPPQLSRQEFERRWLKLKSEGKPTTLENIDPDFGAWLRRVHISLWVWLGVLIGGALSLIVMGFWMLHNGG